LDLGPPGPEPQNQKIQELHLVSLRNQNAIVLLPAVVSKLYRTFRSGCQDAASSLFTVISAGTGCRRPLMKLYPHRADAESTRHDQNRYVRPTLTNTIAFDEGDCFKNIPGMKPARFSAARKCSLMAQRISRLGWLPM